MTISVGELDEVLKLFKASEFDELTIESGDLRVHVRRNGATVTASAAPAAPAQPTALAADQPQAPAPASPVEGAVAVCTTVSGTFYRSPTPTADPFVEVGSRFEAHDPVGLIEVMKLFMSIPAGIDGEVVEIVVEDAAPVQAGDVLMYVRPAA